jgi:dihydrofolate synthase / folylpolyglutamate synthase
VANMPPTNRHSVKTEYNIGMNYQETLDYIYSYIDPARSGPLPDPSLNLRRTEALLHAFGNPEKQFSCVIVAGTKGKGSTCAMIEAIARAAGLKTGLWTSPHLHSYRERIQVDRQLISEAALIDLVEASRSQIEAVADRPDGRPSTFAIGMALAMRYFASQQIDLAVVEIGLGGRFDSANVLTPLVSVITSISYDHMAFLGNSLAEIAAEKAGILKPGVPAVTIRQRHEAQRVIERTAQQIGAPLFVVGAGNINHDTLGKLPIQSALPGVFQQENTELAIGTALRLQAAGLPIDATAIRSGIASVHWPARFEIVPNTPMPVVIDGAHNGDSAQRLVESLRAYYPHQPIVLVFGASQDKDLTRMIPALAAATHTWVLTRSVHPRAFDNLADLRDRIFAEDAEAQITLIADPVAAIRHAEQLAASEGVVCITGSLFVAAAAREAYGLASERDP